jgi:ribonuclease Y
MESMYWLLILCAVGISGILGGVLAFLFAKKSAQNSLLTLDGRDNILKNAERQRAIILDEALRTARERFDSEASRLEEEREVLVRIQSTFEEELNERQVELTKKESDLGASDVALKAKDEATKNSIKETSSISLQRRDLQKMLESHLETKAGVLRSDLEQMLHGEIVDTERLATSRWLLDHGEELRNDAQKFAKETLSVVLARYSPTFVWPKSVFAVQTPSKEISERHFGEESELIRLLIENTDTTIDIMTDGESAPLLKIVGGAGTDKEVIRLVLEEVVGKNLYHPDRARPLIQKYRKQVDRIILKMGEEACRILELRNIHPEILKLIGSLNYRTSHRQNQYFHSLEVARLAGMLANEIGVDHQLAKRSGLLHDIGKALDYKIEGSHAVISGDCAVRFGEEEVVVDTVLAHHDDKIVETAHAYILKAADAMSGARPGARVDMEEGYQKRIEGIAEVVKSFESAGVMGSAIMSAGREVHVFVDNRRIKERDTQPLASKIARKLESDVQFPGQIKVTIVRRIEVSEVA